MPWEKTEKYIRSGHKDPDKYEQCKTIDISAEQGIKAIYCKLKTSDTREIQSYLFDVEKWTMAKAKKWFSEHNAAVNVLQVSFDKDQVRVTPRWTSAPVTLTKVGVHNAAYKPPETIRAMADNDTCMVPLVFDHPPGTDTDPEIHDPDLFIGVVNELHVGTSKGEPAYQGTLHMLNVPETEVFRNAMRAGEPLEVSIGFWFAREEGEGEHNGVEYNHVETDIRVFHLGLMKDHRAACSIEDGCGVGVSSQRGGGLSVGGNGDSGSVEMTDGEDVTKLTIEQLAEKNACVQKLQEEHAARDQELKARSDELAALNKKIEELEDAAAGKDKLAKEVKELQDKMPALEAAANELKARKMAERQARINELIKRASKDSGLKAEDLKDATEAELDRLDKVLPRPEPRGESVVAYGPSGHDEEDEPLAPSLGLDEDRYFGQPMGKVKSPEGGE